MATRASIDASLPKVIIFVAPLVLGLLELDHPALLPGDDIVATIAPIATWWTALHVLQLFALLGVAVFLLIRGLDSRAATVSRYAIAIFYQSPLMQTHGGDSRIG
jgi:hypothetical protein